MSRARPSAALVAGLPGLLYRCRNDAAYTTEFVSDGVAELTGYPAQEFVAHRRHFGDLIVEEDRGRVWEEIQAALAAQRPFELTYRIRNAAGETLWVWEKGHGVYGPGGEVLALEGFLTDIDERKRAAEALRESEQRLRTIIEAEPECVKVVSPEGRLLEMNPAGLAMLEAGSLADVQARPLLEFLLPQHRAAFVALHQRAMRGESGTLEFEVEGLKGARRWLETHAAPLRDAAGAVASLLGITRDVTARKRAEEALRETSERLRMIVESSPLAIYARDRGGRVTSWNPAAERMFGWTAAEVLGRPLPTLPEGAGAESDALRERLLGGEPFVKFEGERLRRDGSAVYVRSFLAPLRGAGSEIEGTIAVVADDTARRAAEAALREERQRLEMVAENVPAMIAYLDAHGRFGYANRRYRQFYGGSDAPIEGKRLDEVLTPQAYGAARDGIERALAGETVRSGGERRLHDGALRHVSRQLVPERDEAGAVRGVYILALDDTARHAAEEGVRRLNRVYAVLSGINSIIVRVRDRNELFREACRVAVEHGGFRMAWIGVVNRAAGVIEPVAWSGTEPRYIALMPLGLDPAGGDAYGLAGRAVAERRAQISEDMTSDPRVLLRLEARERRACSLAVLPLVRSSEALGVLALYASEVDFFDAHEMKLLEELTDDIAFALDHIDQEERVHRLAYYDPLTGLANRALLLERLARLLEAAAREGRKAALAIVNIDRFKSVNDAFGRAGGDEVLRQVSARLVELAGDPGRVARVGADRFAVLVPQVARKENLERRLGECHRRVDGDAYRLAEGGELHLSTRAGVALYPADGGDADTLFRNAEAALKRAASGEPFLFYAPEMSGRASERLALESELRHALERGELALYYQPKVDTATRALAGLEALLRWKSPSRGLVPPVEFIPLLEETGMILRVGAWVLRRAALDHRAWTEAGLRPPRVAVNVSAMQLRQRDFVGIVEEAIIEGVAPVGIDIEVTESMVMEDIEANIAKLEELRRLGVRVAVDDFGTGYSSLAYLMKLPAHALKIDRSFVRVMAEDPDVATLVQTVISLAHSFGLTVVAEGVETEEQAKMLRLLRCDEMQGYLFGQPLPLEATTALLAAART